MVSVDISSFRGRRNLRPLPFILLEAVVFVIYYVFTIFVSYNTYLLYIIGLPAVLITIILLDRGLTDGLSEAFVSADFIVLVATISFWFFIYSLFSFGRFQVLTAVYAPVILEEVNFRYILMEYVGRHMGKGRALIIQAFLFAIWYLYYELFYQGTYPNAFISFLFVFSMFSIGIVYGLIYYFRKSPYIGMSLHLSLLMMILPIVPWYINLISYLMGPV